jgi:hypothetical protein
MNKHILKCISNYDMKVEGSVAYGQIDGYEVNVLENKFGIGPIFLFSTYLTKEQKNIFVQNLLAKKIKLLQVASFDFGVMVVIGAMLASGFEKKFDEVMPLILAELAALNAPKADICPSTGYPLEGEETTLITLPDTKAKIRITSKAVESVNAQISKENEDFKNAPNNYMKGFLGVFIGGLVGVAIAVILSLLGFISFWSPFVSILLGTYLYKKFGGKPNAVMIVMSFVTTLVMIVGYFFLIYTASATALCQEAEIAKKGIDALGYCIENAEGFGRGFTLDLILSALFTVIAAGVSIFSLIQQIRRPKNIK